jgi:hypothetical protein
MTVALCLFRPGWKAETDQIDEIAAKLKRYGLTNNDTVVIDVLSNSVTFSTDAHGMPIDQSKADSKWHVPGSLTHAPKTVVKAILTEVGCKLFGDVSPRLIVVGPLPRYVVEKCCGDPDHIKNAKDPEYISDYELNIEMLDDLLPDGGKR